MTSTTLARWVLECSTPGQPTIRVRMPPGEYTLGRDPACHVLLQGKQVSRRHATIRVGTGSTITLEDLGSFNGTTMEGARIQKAVLKGGEKVGLGEWTLLLRLAAPTDSNTPVVASARLSNAATFEDATAVAGTHGEGLTEKVNVETARAAGATPAAGTPNARARSQLTPTHTPAASISVIMPAVNVQWKAEKAGAAAEPLRERSVSESVLLRTITRHSTPLAARAKTDASDLASLARAQKDPQELALRLVYDVAAKLQVAKGEDDFLSVMADTILQSVRAQTVALLMRAEQSDDPLAVIPRVVRNSASAPEATRFSKSVVDHVLQRKVAITTEDATSDQRFARNASIMALDLKAVLAVPMMRDDTPVGVIYITRKVPFAEWEEDLVAAVGHLTAVGIERAQLKERVAEEEALRHTLERFHTREVVEKLMQKQAQLGGGGLFLEPIDATVLFCDLCGFTAYSEGHTAEQVGELLNGYLGEMTRVVYEFRGTVDKYIGDAVMAVFGAPFPAHDDPVRAARCALAMQEAFKVLMANRPEGERLMLRIGVNTGPVVAGTVGSPLRLEYTCLGDTVNVAQRLESVAPKGGILLGKATAEAVKDVLAVRSKGGMNLKGKSGAVEVFELVQSIPPEP